jgi:hypothetical protein
VFKPSLLFPKAFIKNGRSSGSLFIGNGLPIFLSANSGIICCQLKKLTAAGTAPDFPPAGGAPDSLSKTIFSAKICYFLFFCLKPLVSSFGFL